MADVTGSDRHFTTLGIDQQASILEDLARQPLHSLSADVDGHLLAKRGRPGPDQFVKFGSPRRRLDHPTETGQGTQQDHRQLARVDGAPGQYIESHRLRRHLGW